MLQTFSSREPTAGIFEALARDGGVIVEGLLTSGQVDELSTDFQPHLDAVPWCNTEAGDRDDFFGVRTKRLHGLPARSSRFSNLIVNPLLLAMCDHFLRPHCRDYRVSTGELMALGGGESPQVFHRDADSWHHFPAPRPEILVSANVALTDFTAENGATVVVPGSHAWPRERVAQRSEGVSAVMPRGSALLYLGDVLHGGGANQTDEVRVGLYVGYLLSWLRPIENHLITSGAGALNAAAPRARELLGFSESGWDVIA
ncbi:MAG: phytanoyl-CoA dioxygenase family protein [Myxococcota bacterium]